MEYEQNRNLNLWLVAAGLLMAFTAALHGIAGSAQINRPVQLSELDPIVRAVMAVVWHAATGIFAVFALGLFRIARRRQPALFWTIFAVNLLFIALFLAIGIAALGSFTVMPQWTLFAVMAALMLLSLRQA